jgi:NADPH2:quinone reductase
MRAVIARRPGPPEVLEPVDLPDPGPGPGQVVVDVRIAAVTFVDTQMRSGAFPRIRPEDFPLVLGNGVTGTVATTGEGVDPAWLGAEVVTATGGRGGYVSRAVASVSDLHRVPAGLDPRDAVALLADGRTALGLARAAGVGAGDVVAITAAGGGVGSLLVQIAHRAGATVVALAGAAAKRDLALGLGADAAVDYREAGWPERLAAAAPDGLDVAFDGVGGDVSAPLVAALRRGGRYLPHGGSSGSWAGLDEDEAAERGLTVIPLAAIGAGESEFYGLTEDALAEGAAGRLRPTIGQTWPLDEAAAAHAAIGARATRGKTLLEVSPSSGG